jgi:CHAT domain-containing protein
LHDPESETGDLRRSSNKEIPIVIVLTSFSVLTWTKNRLIIRGEQRREFGQRLLPGVIMKRAARGISFFWGFISVFCFLLLFIDAAPIQEKIERSSAQLDAALRAGEVDRAKLLVLGNVGAADQLFLNYLQRDLAPSQTEKAKDNLLEPARRLAEAFFKLFDLDFELGVVAQWEKASRARKEELLPLLSEHFATYKEERAADDGPFPRYGHDYRLVARYKALAKRYQAISFGKGELQARLRICSYDPDEAWKAWQLAKSLQDEVGEAWAAYHFGIWAAEGEPEAAAEHAVEAAEKLRLPTLSQLALTRQAWRLFNIDDYDGYVDHLRRGLEVIRTIPIPQTMAGRAGRQFYPGEAWFCLTLWRAYKAKDNPEAQGVFERGRALSRQYGGTIGELAYLIDATPQFIQQGINGDVASQAEAMARKLRDPGWLARFLIAKSDALQGTRGTMQAIEAAEEAAELFKKIGSRGYYADCLFRRAGFRTQSNEFEKAETDFRQGIAIYRELGLTEKAASAGLEAGSRLRSQPNRALKLLDEALSDAEKSGNAKLIGAVLYRRGRTTLNDNPASSVQDFLKAISYEEQASLESEAPGGSLGMMNNVSQALRRMGDIGQAIDIQKQRAEKARAQNLLSDEADAYYKLQEIYSRDLGETLAATEYVKKYHILATRPGRKLGVPEYNGIAIAFFDIGQYRQALDAWDSALKLAKGIPGGEYYQRTVHSNSASAYLELGDYQAALDEREQEGDLIEKTLAAFRGPVELQKATWLNKKALARFLVGDLDRAVKDSLAAIELESKTPPRTELAEYYSYFTPGDALAMAGRFDEAADFYTFRRKRAQEINSAREERAALVGLGAVSLKAGNIEKAKDSLLAAVEVGRRPPGPQTGDLADSLLWLARAESRAGNMKRAEELLLEARGCANPYDQNQLWQVERETALVMAGTGRPELAEEHFESALNSLEHSRERLRPEEFSLRFGIDRSRIYDEYISLLAARAVDSGLKADAEKTFQALESRRAQALWDLMSTGWDRLPADAIPEQLRRVRETEKLLSAKQNLLRGQFDIAPERRNAALIKALEAGLETAKKEHARLLSSLAQGKYRFSAPAGLPGDLLPKIQKRLGTDRALVDYFVADDATFAFVITSTGLDFQKMPIGREELRSKARSLLQPFDRLGKGEVDLARAGFDFGTAHELYLRLFAPLEEHLGPIRKILIVPDDVLFYVPIEMLADRLPNKRRAEKVLFGEYEEAGFLVQRFSTSYLTSAARLLPAEESFSLQAKDRLLLAIANPTAIQDSPAIGPEDPWRRQLRSADFSRAFAPLPSSTAEIEAISLNFPASAVTIVSGEKATESCYKELAAEYVILHLATHAVASDDQPLYSTLILTPDATAQEDGFLQAYEILRQPLRAWLVVLSACDTALGPLGRGEGLVGLVSAFQQAGARSVLATQWTIGANAVDLMTSFYKAMTTGRPLADALREAKRETLKRRLRLGDTVVSLAHPYFWAPFVLMIGGAD